MTRRWLWAGPEDVGEGKTGADTTGDHVSLVKGMKSLEVKGDLAQKISGALGIKVQSDIVLESSSRIRRRWAVILWSSIRVAWTLWGRR